MENDLSSGKYLIPTKTAWTLLNTAKFRKKALSSPGIEITTITSVLSSLTLVIVKHGEGNHDFFFLFLVHYIEPTIYQHRLQRIL